MLATTSKRSPWLAIAELLQPRTWLRRWAWTRELRSAQRGIALESRVWLAPQQSVCVVNWEQHRLIVASTSTGITVLKDVTVQNDLREPGEAS